MNMDLRVLRYFLTVVQEEGIVAAANALHMTQPTLSRQLKDLEQELGTQLFVRGNKAQRLVLTDKGQLLRKRAEDLLLLADKTKQEIQQDAQLLNGTVHIGGGESQGMRLIARAAKQLKDKYPLVSFNIFSGNAEDVKERLDKGLLDFGLFIEPTNLQKYAALRLPYIDHWGLLVRRNSPLARKQSLEAKELLKIPLLVSYQQSVIHNFQQWFKLPIEELNIVSTYNLLFNAALMVEEGVGNAVCLDKLAAVSDNSKLCFIPLVPQLPIHLDLAWRQYQPLSKEASAFLREVEALCAEK